MWKYLELVLTTNIISAFNQKPIQKFKTLGRWDFKLNMQLVSTQNDMRVSKWINC